MCVDISDIPTDDGLYSLVKFCCWSVWRKLAEMCLNQHLIFFVCVCLFLRWSNVMPFSLSAIDVSQCLTVLQYEAISAIFLPNILIDKINFPKSCSLLRYLKFFYYCHLKMKMLVECCISFLIKSLVGFIFVSCPNMEQSWFLNFLLCNCLKKTRTIVVMNSCRRVTKILRLFNNNANRELSKCF